jgi:hypothetical protein
MTLKSVAITAICFFAFLPSQAAQNEKSPEETALRDTMSNAFNRADSAAFFVAVKKLQDYLLEHDDLHGYYTQRCNEIVFQLNRQNIYEAYKLSIKLSHELRERKLERELYMPLNMMGHIYRYLPIVGLVRQDIAEGKYGKVTHGTIYVRWGHGEDYYQSAAWRGTWKSDGGALMNQTIHAIDLLVWLMGSEPEEATSMIAQRLRKIEAEDLGMAVLRLENGALAQIEGTTATITSKHTAEFSVFCENGQLSMGLDSGKPHLNIYTVKENGKIKKLNGYYIRKQFKEGGMFSYKCALNPHLGIYKDLAGAIAENRNPIADAYAGFSSVDTLLGIYKSAKEGHPVKLPLDSDFNSVDMTGFFE